MNLNRLAGSIYGMYLAESYITGQITQCKQFEIVIESFIELKSFNARDHMNRLIKWVDETQPSSLDQSTSEAIKIYRSKVQQNGDAKPFQGERDPRVRSVVPLIR